MSRRRYSLLCPIARALDRVGDRWTLLILRDLHAGPARFNDIQSSLPGLAPNLLTSRLRRLEEDGLIRQRRADFNVSVYELTDVGEETRSLLYELSLFGAQFEPDSQIKEPGNLRNIAVTISVAVERVVDPEADLDAELLVNGQPFAFRVRAGRVTVRAREAEEPQATIALDYEAMVAYADGRMTLEEFSAQGGLSVSGDPATGGAVLSLLARAFEPNFARRTPTGDRQ